MRALVATAKQSQEAGVDAENDGEEPVDVTHERDGEFKIERRENEGESADSGVALGDAGPNQDALQKKRK
jgi:hypothetical protein